jgi:hypothetical protein
MGTRDELLGRLELGLKRYKHGVRVDDDTRTWGTPTNSWIDMAREELLDAIIYTVADYIRSEGLSFRQNDESDDNKLIMSIVDNWECVKSPQHKMVLWNLFKILNSNIYSSTRIKCGETHYSD